MPSERRTEAKRVIVAVLGVFTTIGIVGAGQEADLGIAVTWVWMGIGLSVTYLLYRVVLTLEQFVDSP
ncbi:Mn2+/Fe2+ transporter [Natrinema amylolyticum]|uniref:Mn2+/Fe2+ transporter n=1 Tax=Natrinema amylolyticum TaxID=2878679 RepID=UPI001CFA64C8|nr:Mn2+/Fe2+ transporter [Natrinema amylolyticum]